MTIKLLFLVAVLLVFVSTLASQTTDRFVYRIADMPFNATPIRQEIDKRCRAERTANDNNSAAVAQNLAKNNFGVSASAPIPVEVSDLKTLQEATDALHLKLSSAVPHLPVDRGLIKNLIQGTNGTLLGEGTLVVLTAQIYGSHYSDSELSGGEGESVNCKGLNNSTKATWNDLHVVLMDRNQPMSDDECESVTAEISPHFRPAAWSHFHNKKYPKGHPVGFDREAFDLVRVTGPLFFDGSHKTCKNGKGSPKRQAVWEIHPIYKLEVHVKGGNWMSFENWAKATGLDKKFFE